MFIHLFTKNYFRLLPDGNFQLLCSAAFPKVSIIPNFKLLACLCLSVFFYLAFNEKGVLDFLKI